MAPPRALSAADEPVGFSVRPRSPPLGFWSCACSAWSVRCRPVRRPPDCVLARCACAPVADTGSATAADAGARDRGRARGRRQRALSRPVARRQVVSIPAGSGATSASHRGHDDAQLLRMSGTGVDRAFVAAVRKPAVGVRRPAPPIGKRDPRQGSPDMPGVDDTAGLPTRTK